MAPEIRIDEAEDFFRKDAVIYRAEVKILRGTEKAVGIDATPEGAVEQLAIWLADCATEFKSDGKIFR